jgi:hypothetical protein
MFAKSRCRRDGNGDLPGRSHTRTSLVGSYMLHPYPYPYAMVGIAAVMHPGA